MKFPMGYLKSLSFWALLIVGWLISVCLLGLFARYFASFDEMSQKELWATGLIINALALLSGFAFARSKAAPPPRSR